MGEADGEHTQKRAATVTGTGKTRAGTESQRRRELVTGGGARIRTPPCLLDLEPTPFPPPHSAPRPGRQLPYLWAPSQALTSKDLRW